MPLRRWHPPLWVAVLAAPVMCNAFALAGAAVGYYGFGWSWAPIAMLFVWFRFAGRLLAMVDGYETTDSRRAVAVVAAIFWLVVSFVLIFAAVDVLAQAARG